VEAEAAKSHNIVVDIIQIEVEDNFLTVSQMFTKDKMVTINKIAQMEQVICKE
jgi:hypothetical protein